MKLVVTALLLAQVQIVELPTPAAAELEFGRLVAASDLIVLADQVDPPPENHQIGETVAFEIREVFYGQAEIGRKVTVFAPSELPNRLSLFGTWLLFLKQDEGQTVRPAVEGLSIWPLLWPAWSCDCSGDTWDLPTELLSFSESDLITRGCFGETPAVCGPDLRAFIAQAREVQPTQLPS